jgi:stage II sporulation protein D
MGWSRRWGAVIVAVVWAVAGTAGSSAGWAPGVGGSRAAASASDPRPDPWVVERPRFEPVGGPGLVVAGVGEYRGAIEVVRGPGGLAAVDDVALEEYLRGISEVPSSWPLEAQKAQAIAARTYVLHEVGGRASTPARQVGADICATASCQVYVGLTKERLAGSERWSAAVQQTKGQVLVFRGAPIVAKYSSSNGGRSVSGGQPYLREEDDPDDRYSPLHQWQAAFPASDVVAATGLAAEPLALRREGDAVIATYVDPDGGDVLERVSAADFRSRANAALPTPEGLPLAVPSLRFDVSVEDGFVHIAGRGWGHGIGLSQYGALGKALRGMQAADILAAYYAGLRPLTVPEDRLPGRVRVAVALDRQELTIGDAATRFRIVDGSGTVVAHSATGSWKAVPAGRDGRVRLVPPAEELAPPTAAVASTDPGTPLAGRPLAAGVELAGPAAVTRISWVRPDGSTVELDPPRLRRAGPLTVRLGVVGAGEHRLVVERDAGGGRLWTDELAITVARDRAATPTQPPGPRAAVVSTTPISTPRSPGGSALLALATGLVLAVGLTAGRRAAREVGRRRGVAVH